MTTNKPHQTKRIKRDLPMQLNDSQLALKRDALAAAVVTRTELERDIKDHCAGQRKLIKDQKATAKRLAEEIMSATETASVDCEEEYVFAQNKVIVRRLDTREIVEERAMTSDERQEPLPIDVNGKGGKSIKLVPNGGKPAH